MSVSAPNTEPITLPQQPVRSPPSPFPVLAALAPVVVSVLIWLVTGSIFALMFAALGPVIAIASVIDSRWSSGRRLKKDSAAYAAELASISQLIDTRLDEERRARRRNAPGARALARSMTSVPRQTAPPRPPQDGGGSDVARAVRVGRWRSNGAARTRVVAGTGTLPSTLRIDGAVDSAAARGLRDRARLVSGVPVDIDAVRGIGVVGASLPARAFVRGVLLQLCNAMGPDTAEVRTEGDAWRWASALPHASTGRGVPVTVVIRDLTAEAGPLPDQPVAGGRSVAADRNHASARPGRAVGDGDGVTTVLIVLARTVEEIPPECGAVVEITGLASAVLHDSDQDRASGVTRTATLTLELLTEVECESFAQALAGLAERLGVAAAASDLPAHVDFGAVHRLVGNEGTLDVKGGSSLSAVLGLGDGAGASTGGADGEGGAFGGGAAVLVDIVTDGPHAIVGGTTGSGKSELLTTWVASMAMRHSPAVVTFLLVDFKGGSAFAPLRSLPHVVGLITDLDEVAAARALASLSAEIVYRERMLADLGSRDIAETRGAFPRLVIVVDEFAAMLDGFPDLHALFVDIAARGRSLGMHLILCTQRPAGVVRDALLANCGLRLSLRVHSRGDSVAVIGTDSAAHLPTSTPGRLILATGGRERRVQVASVLQAEIESIAASTQPGIEPRRPWLDPLPVRLALSDLELLNDTNAAPDTIPNAIRIGLADLPGLQRQDTALWMPETDGSVVVVGTARSGKTTVLDTVTAEAMASGDTATRSRQGSRPGGQGWRLFRVGTDDEETWDTVVGLAASLRTPVTAATAGAGSQQRAAAQRQGDKTLLLIDDLDSTLARLDDDYATRLRDAVVELLRDGPRRSVWVMLTLKRLAGALSVVSGFAGAVLMLRMANRQEHLMTGGDSSTWVANRPDGNAVWRGATVQIAVADTMTGPESGRGRADPARHGRSSTAPEYVLGQHALTVLVCRSPQQRVESILNDPSHRRAPVRVVAVGSATRITAGDLGLDAPGTLVLVGDSDDWQTQWALFAALRQDAELILDGCTVAEYRALTKRRELPPLLVWPGHAWHLPPGGQTRRVSLG
ncbi:FtsK/SpoIIIE domain-containing protein [Mycetocola zhujimingii]|uniref:FtsK domain-containing protein n=1 Tax=Mycetocola zhujimingii TaxID=2079792 RepID=A0A2U1TEH2_9MICO|nr:FtsK/SpoIIIE domain-containing protein [Mycetocola zhujimingii]PWC07307.1 hypothetical protein DF223_06685 [Mycetocola zhujimingii]